MHRRYAWLTLAGLLIVLVVGCSTSGNRLVSSWKDPSVKKLSFQRIVTIALTEDGPIRRAAEREMAAIVGPKAVPSSQVIPDADIKDADKVRAKLASDGFDGAITLRLVDATIKVQTSRDPVPTAYYSIWGYYRFAWVADRPPDQLTAEQKLQIECNIYSLQSGKLLWTGTSEVMQPHLVETAVQDVADLVRRRLKSEGLI
jgi:hypothetical protein